MTVSTFTQPNYSSDLGTTYPTNIDGAINVLAQIGQDFAPHQAATANLTVLIDAGKIIKADGTLVSQAQQTATFVAPTTNPRIDRIVIDMLTGAYSIIAGTEAASPTAPAITAGKLPCAQVSLVVGQTQITNANITDERTALVSSPQITYHTATGTDTYTVSGLTLVQGFDYRINFTNANTSTAPTVNGTTIKKEGGAALAIGDIPANHAGVLRHNGTDFILLNPAARLSATGETLRIIRGRVSVTGTVDNGTGFSASRSAAGSYTITYTTAFSSLPSVVVTDNQGGNRVAAVHTETTTGCGIYKITASTAAFADSGFNFIAIGPA